MVFNMVDGPTTNPAVRKAVRLAYYQGALRAFRGGADTVSTGPLPNTMSCRLNLPPAHRDLAEAPADPEPGRYRPADVDHEVTLLQSNLAAIG
ncbi:hypothetical protein [Saccharopolyspora hattusasensis]|uniref:hypothetical protein n=1 Tax=Saccharopolyspora hattusasensis TaxID=1128679 RepID=UPI003D9531EE